MKVTKIGAIALLTGFMLTVTGCGPGSSTSQAPTELNEVSKNVAAAGEVTLTVWDQNVEGTMPEAQQELNEEFQKQYPNVKIQRTAQSFKDLKTTLKLALSSNTPPDVIQANQGYPDMGAFVEAGMLRPLNDYSKLYGWDQYFPSRLLKLNSFSTDGKQWQGDNLYGVSQTGELIGIYYNKSKLKELGLDVPSNLSEFEQAMGKAKASGLLPLAYGDLEKSPGIQLLGVVQAAIGGSDYVSNLVSGKSGAWTDQQTVDAVAKIADWQDKGWLTEGSNGVSRDTAISDFSQGKALFTVQGTWQASTLEKNMGEDVGFFVLNSNVGNEPVTTGGEGLGWAITSKSAHPDVAAAYIDFVTNAKAAESVIKTGNISTVLPDDYAPTAGTVNADIAEAYRSIGKSDGVVPYLDYTTPTAYDTIAAGMQDLIGGKLTPSDLTKQLQDNYATFLNER